MAFYYSPRKVAHFLILTWQEEWDHVYGSLTKCTWTSALLCGSCYSGVFVLLVEMPKVWAGNSWGSGIKRGSRTAKLATARPNFNKTWCHHPDLGAQPPFYSTFQDLPPSRTTWTTNNNNPGAGSEAFGFQCLLQGCLIFVLYQGALSPIENPTIPMVSHS